MESQHCQRTEEKECRIRADTSASKAKQKRYAPEKEFWLRKFVIEALKYGMYELTKVANGLPSAWCTDASSKLRKHRAKIKSS